MRGEMTNDEIRMTNSKPLPKQRCGTSLVLPASSFIRHSPFRNLPDFLS